MSGDSTTLLDGVGLLDGIESYIMVATGFSQSVTDLLLAALVLAASVLLARSARYFLARVAPRLVAWTRTSLDDEVIKAMNGPLQWLIVALGVYVAVQEVEYLWGLTNAYLDNLLIVALVFIAAYLLANLVNGLLSWYRSDIAPKTQSDFDDALVPFLKRIAGAVIMVVATLVALEQLKIVEITPLITGLGVAGIAVALAAQELLSNFFGSVSILVDRPYQVGDRVRIGDIEPGNVVEIGLRSTKLQTMDNRVIIVPNAKVSKSRVINYAMPDARVIFNLNVGIAYDADVEKAKRTILAIAEATEGVLKDPPPRIYVTELGNFAVKLLIQVDVESYRMDWPIIDQIYRGIIKRFAAEGIEIPYPITNVIVRREDAGVIATVPIAPQQAVR